MKIKLSKAQWEKIGYRAGWMKIAELSHEELVEAWENHEEDITVNEKGEAYHGGKMICGPNEEYGTDFKAIAKWMHEHKYFPNVWTVNDHGNVSLYSVDENGQETYWGGLV